jgi:hypothetical protein
MERMIELREVEGAILLPLRVVPGASRTRAAGIWNGRLKVAIAAPPERGRANRMLIEWLAETLDVPRKELTIVAGATTALKTIRIGHASLRQVAEALERVRS